MNIDVGSIPLHHPNFDVRNSDSLSSDIHNADARKSAVPPPPKVEPDLFKRFEWSRRIAITTEPLWIAKVRRHKFRSFMLVFLPSVVIFMLAFFLAPPEAHSRGNDLRFYLGGGVSKPTMPLTAGVVPKRFHSHDDYKQDAPLTAALSYGASSIEVAVWEDNGQLLVGDGPSSVSNNKTLESLYLDPIMQLINNANDVKIGNRTYGVFATAPYLPLQLVITIYSDGTSGFDLLLEALEPFRNAGYLTVVNMSDSSPQLNYGALTVIGSGNTPIACVMNEEPKGPLRYVFYDAPLDDLNSDVDYTPTLSPMASAPWGSTIGARWLIPSLARSKIRQYVAQAHNRGIEARFWGTPTIPGWARNKIWQMLLDEGADWLDVDDLCDASVF